MDRKLSRQSKIANKQPLPVVWHICANRWHSAITEYAFSAHAALKDVGVSSCLMLKANSAAASAADRMKLDYLPIADQPLKVLFESLRLHAENRPSHVFCYGGSDEFSSLFIGARTSRIRFRGDLPRGIASHPHMRSALTSLFGVRTIYPSQYLRSKVETASSDESSRLVHLGRSTATYFPETDQIAAEMKSPRPTILIVGRLDPIKGHREFLAIFSKALRAIASKGASPLPHLKIVGEPKNLSAMEIRRSAEILGLVEGEDWSLISNRVENIRVEMSSATLGAIPSLGSELIVRVAEEFILCGTPIFTSGVGSLDEISVADFGWSYLGKNQEEAAILLERALISSCSENQAARIRRATLAAQQYSLTVMGQNLLGLLS